MTKAAKVRCEAVVWSGWRHSPCRNSAKVERGGKWYCGVHDPEVKAARKKKREDEWRAKWDADREREAQAKARCVALGHGRPGGKGVYLTLDEADALIARLAGRDR